MKQTPATFAVAADPVKAESLGRHNDTIFFAQGGVWPDDLRQILAGAFELPKHKIDITRQHSGSYEIFIRGDGFSDTYEIDFRLRRLNHGTLVSTRNDRRTGRKAFAWRCIVARLMDLDRVSVYASMKLGGYIWAKAGVRTDDLANIRFICQQRLSEIAEQLPAQDKAHVEKLLRFENPSDLQTLARSTIPVADAERCFDRVVPEPFSFQSYREAGLFQADTLTLGQYLLAGQKYHARVDVQDAAHLDVIGAYCGVDIAAVADGLSRSTQRAEYSSIPAFQTAHPR
jgi:hypothetical protein